MKPQNLIPIIVIALAAYFGWQQHQNCSIQLPGLPVPSACQAPVVNTPPVTTPTTPPVTTPTTPPVTTPTTPPVATPTTPPVTTPTTPPVTTPSTPTTTAPATSGYPEASLTTPDVQVAVNLRPERAEIVNVYTSGTYADALEKADAWLNSRPTDALIGLIRNNALTKQLGSKAITIGLSVPTSGSSVQQGEAILQGVNMAVLEFSQPSLGNKRVIVEIRNDQNDRSLAVQAASSLASLSEVLGVIGPVNSSASVAAADIYNAQGLVHIAPAATDDRLANKGGFTYRLAVPSSVQGKSLAKIAQQRGYVRIPVYFDPKDAYSKSLADAFMQDATALSISTVPIEFPTKGLPADFSIFQDDPRPDAVFLSGTAADCARLATALAGAGVQLPMLTGSAAYSQELLAGGKAVEGLTMLSFFHATSTIGNTTAFVKAFQKRYGGGTPNARAMQAYDATRALLEAIKRSSTATRANVKKALDGFSSKPAPGVTSPVQFKAGAIQNRPLVIIEVKDGKLEATGVM
jgi:branched-chain amino acid transport system substrate-binding protein